MLAVNGYYNGNNIMLEHDVKLSIGEQVLLTIVDNTAKPKEKIDLSKYMGRGKKLIDEDAQESVRRLRDNDRM